MLAFLNILFTFLHIMIILFNLLGWIWERMRKFHLCTVAITLASWLILGLKFGLGYCFLTDWHWDIKRQLGERHLPNSFIQYIFQEMDINISATMTNQITGIGFAIAIGMTLYVNFIKKDRIIISK